MRIKEEETCLTLQQHDDDDDDDDDDELIVICFKKDFAIFGTTCKVILKSLKSDDWRDT